MKLSLVILCLTALAGCASGDANPMGISHKSYPLKHAVADQVAQTLSVEVGRTPGHRIVIVADPKINAVVVRGTPDDHIQIEKRIRELDVK